MGCLFWQYSQIDNSVFRSKRVICTLLKTKEIYIVFHCARGLSDFRTMEMVHCFPFHSRNTLQKQGDIFDFQLHTGNTLYNEVFCWATRLQNEGNKEQGKYIFKREILSLTLKERGIHAYVACLLWRYSQIDNFFRTKRVICTGNIYCFPLRPG